MSLSSYYTRCRNLFYPVNYSPDAISLTTRNKFTLSQFKQVQLEKFYILIRTSFPSGIFFISCSKNFYPITPLSAGEKNLYIRSFNLGVDLEQNKIYLRKKL